jgi:hexosaminidase
MKARDLPAVIPAPRMCLRTAGFFSLTRATQVCVDPWSAHSGRLLAETMRRSTGFPLEVVTRERWTGPAAGSILITASNADRGLGSEGYELTASPDSVTVSAAAASGAFYGAQTLLQLLPAAVYSAAHAAHEGWSMPCVRIEDAPRFPWRGFMLDACRHFFTKEDIKRFLALMSLHKLNVFHWHLTEDQGWRLQIPKYPRLTDFAAWRRGVGFGDDPSCATAYGPDGRYGGFYSAEDVREVVAYARDRHITVVPEIEMPGHSSAALAAFPNLGCTGGPYTVPEDAGVFHGVYCAGKEETFDFLHDVLDEVFELFPGPYVHVGGDEAPKDDWKKCPHCQARMKTEGLRNEDELQSYFIRRIERHLNAHDRSLVGWSEIREGGLAHNAVVMDWIGGAMEAAMAGHDVVMAPTEFCYLDYRQLGEHVPDRGFPGRFLSLSKTYAFEPVPAGLAPELQRHILGGQGNLWTERVPAKKDVEYMAFPRLCALAEAVWSQKEARSEAGFLRRLAVHRGRLDELNVGYCAGAMPDMAGV